MAGKLSNAPVIPSAVPTEAGLDAWRDLPRSEQVRRLRQIVTSREGSVPCEGTMADIWADIEGDALRAAGPN